MVKCLDKSRVLLTSSQEIFYTGSKSGVSQLIIPWAVFTGLKSGVAQSVMPTALDSGTFQMPALVP
jgi:hypothetical protein